MDAPVAARRFGHDRAAVGQESPRPLVPASRRKRRQAPTGRRVEERDLAPLFPDDQALSAVVEPDAERTADVFDGRRLLEPPRVDLEIEDPDRSQSGGRVTGRDRAERPHPVDAQLFFAQEHDAQVVFGGIRGGGGEEAAGRHLEDADRLLFDDGQPGAVRRHRDIPHPRRDRRPDTPRLSSAEAADPDILGAARVQAGALRPRRGRSVAGKSDRAVARGPRPDEPPRGDVVEERSPVVHAAPRETLDLDPASPGSGRFDPDSEQVVRSRRKKPAHVSERDTREREEQDPEHDKARAGSPDYVHAADRDLRAAGREEGHGAGGEGPEGNPQGQDGGVREK